MSTVDVISTQYSQSGRNYSFKSKTETHLSLRISSPDELDQKIKFTAVQLSKMNFNQQMLEPPRLPELVQKLLNFKFVPLLPLEKNPLKETHPGGLCQWISEDHPYRQDNLAWCEAASEFPKITDAPLYTQQIAEYKTKMGLPDVEEQLSLLEEEYLEKIDAALEKLLGKENPHEAVVEAAMGTIYESIYQLIVMPIKDVLSYMQTPINVFMMNQMEFRSELEKKLPAAQDPISQEILEKIIRAMEDRSLKETEQTLIAQYSDRTEMVQELVHTAEELIQQALARADAQIDQYWQSPEMQFSFGAIFNRCEHLWEKYQMMLNGRYTSLKEIPRGLNDGKIHVLSYSGPLCKLLRACEAFLSSNEPNRKEMFNTSCRKFFGYRRGAAHFQNSIQPLLKLLQPIRNILAWPGVYELSEGEQKYMSMNLYFLMAISNTQMSGKSLIPYDLLSISDEDLKIAENHLKNRKSSMEQKRKACRTLFHARIPWKALQAIGSLMHRSGGVPEKMAQINQQRVGAALTDLVPELSIAAEAIQDLLEFEAMEFSPNPSTVAPAKLPDGCYANIHLLGSSSEIERNMKKAQEVLSLWRNWPFTQDDFRSKKIRFAILRTIQTIGEISKNLNRVGFLSEDPIWDLVEALRDLLAHTDRVSISKRLKVLIHDPDSNVLRNVLEDFRTLLEYFEQKNASFNDAQTWTDRKRLQAAISKTYLEFRGLQDLYIFLAAKLPTQTTETLKQTIEMEGSVQAREEMLSIKKAFLESSSKLDSIELEKLPLTKKQIKTLKEAIKVFKSTVAAKNNAREAKLGALKASVKLCREFQKSRVLTVCNMQLEELSLQINNLEKLIDSSDFARHLPPLIDLFNQIEQVWSSNQIPTPEEHWQTLKDNLVILAETVEGFVERKKIEYESLLQSLLLYEDLSAAKQVAGELIRDMQLEQVGKEDFILKIKTLGVIKDEWEKAYRLCTAKKTPIQKSEEAPAINPLEETKKKTLRGIRGIIDSLQKLDELLIGCVGPNGLDRFQKDRHMQLASEYLVADFRAQAASLEECLEFIKYTVPLDPQFLQSIQDSLQSSIIKGNEILHVHEVTQQSTMTEYGRRLVLFQHIQSLLLNWNGGKDKDVLIESLHLKIVQLEEFIEKIETV